MIDYLGETLTYAATIAISPIPIIAVILMLRSAHPKPMGLGFLAGWFAGIVVATGLLTLLATNMPERDDSSGPQPSTGTIRLILGALLLFLAIKQWRTRPRPGETPELPTWLQSIEAIKPRASVGFGFMLAALNPKNLVMAGAASVVFGHATLEPTQVVGTVAIFTVLAGLSVLIPVVLYLLAPVKVSGMLGRAMEWLTFNSSTIVMVVLLVLGIQLIGQGIESF